MCEIASVSTLEASLLLTYAAVLQICPGERLPFQLYCPFGQNYSW